MLVEFCTNIFVFVSWAHMGEFLFIWCVHKVDCWYHLELLLYTKKKIFKSWSSSALSIYAFDLILCVCAFDLIFHVCVCVCVCVYYRWGYYWDLIYIFFFDLCCPFSIYQVPVNFWFFYWFYFVPLCYLSISLTKLPYLRIAS